MSKPFKRDLARGFFDQLREGSLWPLLDLALASDLDLQLRGKYINLYCDGQAILKLTDVPTKREYKVEIDPEYLVGAELPCQAGPRECRLNESTADHWVAEYVRQIGLICANARPTGPGETTAEQALIRTSLRPESPLVLIDRQVAVPGPERFEVDVVGLVRGDPSLFVLGEAKLGGNPQIRCLPCQLSDYYPMLVGSEGRLREDMFASYTQVVRQKRDLGLLPDSVAMPTASPRVGCLIILCDLGGNEHLLDEARARASICDFPVWIVRPCGPDYPIPPPTEWETLCP
ncbi:MAG: hypothetical protein KKI08_08595 [Armatimonadetes bacterium]|nr:hypothetical protein [Armatimonadota bacterium]